MSSPSQSLPSSPPLPPPLHSVESQAIDMITHESPVPDHVTSDHIEETLYERVIDEDWEAVLKIYKEHKPIVHGAKLLRSEETALHMAISSSKIDVAKELLKIIDQDKIQGLTNGRGDNPLHLAASLGQVEMCKLLLEKDRRLIWNRNKEGETPLFLAVLQGQKGAFYALHPICTDTDHNIVTLCKKNDGNTILHVSILGEHFELASQIIDWYPQLILLRNERGQLALHFLANNPSAFKSGSFLGMIDEFIYGCLIVDTVKVKMPSPLDDKQYSGPVYFQVGNLKEQKRRHKLTYEIMEKLISPMHRWEYWETLSRFNPQINRSNGASLSLQNQEECMDEDQPSEDTSEINKATNKETIENKIISALKRTKMLVEVEKSRSGVCRLQMLGIDKQDDSEESSLILIAAKFGVVELVQRLLHAFPQAIHQHDSDNKNVALLASENRHQNICLLLLSKYSHHKRIFQQVDNNGNTAIHLAANLGESWRWRISGAAILLQWELKWYNFIKSSIAPNLLGHRNKEGKSSKEVFDETHEDMVKDAVKWLNSVSQSCSVVATIIATMAYTSATTVPGGTDQTKGIPILRGRPAFGIFTISSLIALCFSLGSLTLFLSILTSHYNAIDFLRSVPRKVILGFTSLFISSAAMLVSFCAGHFFNLEAHMRHTAFPIYIITCSLGSIYVLTQFPLYFSLIKSTF